MNAGIAYAILAFVAWGLFPLYFRMLQSVPALELVCHRIVWSFLLLVLVFAVTRNRKSLRISVRAKHVLVLHLLSSIMIGLNWLIYVWAVNSDRVLESSLGYFLNPLLNILLGVMAFKERLKPIQWLAVGLAGVGMIYLSIVYGAIPWVAISLALSFGLYGLLKKIATIPAMHGLLLETAFLVLPAGVYLVWGGTSWGGGGGGALWLERILLMATGIVTIVPLLLFALATARIPLSLLGFLQYLTPSLQFLLGVYLYHEPFTRPLQISFGCIWLALVLVWIPLVKRNAVIKSRNSTQP